MPPYCLPDEEEVPVPPPPPRPDVRRRGRDRGNRNEEERLNFERINRDDPTYEILRRLYRDRLELRARQNVAEAAEGARPIFVPRNVADNNNHQARNEEMARELIERFRDRANRFPERRSQYVLVEELRLRNNERNEE